MWIVGVLIKLIVMFGGVYVRGFFFGEYIEDILCEVGVSEE